MLDWEHQTAKVEDMNSGLVVKGLEPGKSYRFCIKTRSKFGLGPACCLNALLDHRKGETR